MEMQQVHLVCNILLLVITMAEIVWVALNFVLSHNLIKYKYKALKHKMQVDEKRMHLENLLRAINYFLCISISSTVVYAVYNGIGMFKGNNLRELWIISGMLLLAFIAKQLGDTWKATKCEEQTIISKVREERKQRAYREEKERQSRLTEMFVDI